MSDTITTSVEDLKSVWTSELQPRIDQMESERKTYGEVTAETKASLALVNDRLDQIEAKATKAAAYAPNTAAVTQEHKDFMQYTREGHPSG